MVQIGDGLAMKTSTCLIKVFINIPAITKGTFQEVVAESDSATVGSIFMRLLKDNNAPISDYFDSERWKKDYLVIVNGTITKDPSALLKDQDRVLVTTLMGGG
jgi:hypothetical protein